MKSKLPPDNELPATTHEAKKVICPLGLDVQKIHACINDCILYRGEKYESMDNLKRGAVEPLPSRFFLSTGTDDPPPPPSLRARPRGASSVPVRGPTGIIIGPGC